MSTDHLTAILEEYGRQQGFRLQLAVYRQNREHILIKNKDQIQIQTV
jgi:hypothetical protein